MVAACVRARACVVMVVGGQRPQGPCGRALVKARAQEPVSRTRAENTIE